MSARASKVRVVVDGSNLATEGRTTPSFAQLREALAAFIEENPRSEVIVVTDASFEHRVASGERAAFVESLLAGDIVTPPAGAIGRGDAFILKIADRISGVVLSNDSFQEFHDEYPWLFDEGRLVGGKPVRGVGWIFTARNPVRNPKTTRASKKSATTDFEAEALDADSVKPARTVTKRRVKKIDVPAVTPEVAAPAVGGVTADPARKGLKATASKLAKVARAPKVTKSTRAVASPPEDRPVKNVNAAKLTKATKSTKASRATKTSSARGTTKKVAKAPPKKSKAPLGGTAEPNLSTGPAPTEALRRGRQPVNPEDVFEAFAKSFKVGSRMEGRVSTFTSHGAVIKVTLANASEMECYAPTASLGSPAPARARDVLNRGDVKTFRLVSVDAQRRIAELSLL